MGYAGNSAEFVSSAPNLRSFRRQVGVSLSSWRSRATGLSGCFATTGSPADASRAERAGDERDHDQKRAKRSDLGDVAQGMGGGVHFGLLDHEEFTICSCYVRVNADCSHLSFGWLTRARKTMARPPKPGSGPGRGSLHDICFSAGGPDRAPASRLLGKALYGEGAEFCVFLANLPGLLVRC